MSSALALALGVVAIVQAAMLHTKGWRTPAAEVARLDALKAETEAEEAVYKTETLERGEPFDCPTGWPRSRHRHVGAFVVA